jgi:hypothetical protein
MLTRELQVSLGRLGIQWKSIENTDSQGSRWEPNGASKGVSWNSVEIPVWTPRPKLTPMTNLLQGRKR